MRLGHSIHVESRRPDIGHVDCSVQQVAGQHGQGLWEAPRYAQRDRGEVAGGD
ncbi:hypothetical protein AB0D83_30865 [Streptomyces decoyicus]|uniref:hypothetical protein n=1 Tax=Streptomyces decoyicus TaxID=249567 RepID=UPI0033EA5333